MKFPKLGPFLTTKRKLLDLLILLVANTALFFIWESWEIITLFSFGFIWNWVAAHDLNFVRDNPRYRFSMVKLVFNLQTMVQRPLPKAPGLVKKILGIFPAGIFWSLIIFSNDAAMPWWATFLGSLFFEIVQWEARSIKAEQEGAL